MGQRGKHRGPAATLTLLEFFRQHPARLYSIATAALTLVALHMPDMQEAILALVAAILGAGEVTQRVETRLISLSSRKLSSRGRAAALLTCTPFR